VKRGRRYGQITLRRVTIGHFADVRVDTKNFLYHHHGTLGGALGMSHISGKFKAIGGVESNGHSEPYLKFFESQYQTGYSVF
jgi:hypothetical protein